MKLPIVSCAGMRRIEEATFADGITAESLMEKVGMQIAAAAALHGPASGVVIVYYGKGHNGGDALVAARHLTMAGWGIELRPQEPDRTKLAALTRKQLEALDSAKLPPMPRDANLTPRRIVVLDGLLGLGATGPLRDDVRMLTREINAWRSNGNALVIAVDLPTGLNGDTGEADPDCVVADITVAAGYAKMGLLADAAPAQVGRLQIAPLREFEAHAPVDLAEETATPESMRGILPRRNFDSHKTQYGRVGIVAGSQGFTGAAILCASGALRGGAGLVTLYATEDTYLLLAATAPPEVMVRPVKSYAEVLDEKHDVIALGPGLGKAHAGTILQLIKDASCPMVVDADGLNILAEHGVDILEQCAGPRLLTPHPGEMARLFPLEKDLSRLETATRFSHAHPVTLLLKGSRTIICEKGKSASYNTTGNPGMGTGGMGDVLTGVAAALIGQRLGLYDAARLGAWLCGRAAEIAVRQGRGEEGLLAMDVVDALGMAFIDFREGRG